MPANVSPAATLLAGVALAALLAGTPVALAARSFSTPVAISLNGNVTGGAAEIDGSGRALAVWTDNGSYYSDHLPGGGWTAAALFTPVVAPGSRTAMHLTAAGAATLVSFEPSTGVWAADRPAGGAWGDAAVIVSGLALLPPLAGPSLQFLADSRGDQAVVYEDYSASAHRLRVVRRTWRSQWQNPETILDEAVAGRFALSASAIGENGDVVVTWQSYTVGCGRVCTDDNFTVHAERVNAGVWTDSGPITPSNGIFGPYRTAVAIDPRGRAVVLSQNGPHPLVLASVQAQAGAGWSTPATAFSGPAGDAVGMWGVATTAGAARLALADLTGAGGSIDVVAGDLAANAWAAPLNLAAADPAKPADGVGFGAEPAGAAVAAWTDRTGAVRASFAHSPLSAWSASQTLVKLAACYIAAPCTVALTAAIDRRTDAVVLFSRSDENGNNRTLYALTR